MTALRHRKVRASLPWQESTITSAIRPPDWHEDALCAEVGGDLFFPEQSESALAAKAKQVCRSCIVRTLCLQDALDRNESWGVWGGMTLGERKVEFGRLEVAA